MDGLTYKRSLALGGAGHGSSGVRRAPCPVPDLKPLLDAVETEVIPRLLGQDRARLGGTMKPEPGDLEALCGFAMERDIDGAMALVDRLRDRGVGEGAILTDLMSGTARRLGALWENDRVSFFDVSIGLCTLHQVLFRLDGDDRSDQHGEGRGRVLLAATPGDPHVFGTLVVSKVFGRAGWQTWVEIEADRERLVAVVAENGFDMVCLSLSADRHIAEAEATIAAMRAAAPGPAPFIVLGGSSSDADPGLARRIGADSGVRDPSSAVGLGVARLERSTSDD